MSDRRPAHRDVWAIVPVKEAAHAKQRLAGALSPHSRQELAVAMFEDVMQALAGVSDLAGTAVVTLDPRAGEIARRWGAEVWTDGARDGHTGAVTAAARRLGAAGSTLLTIPGDIPLVTPDAIEELLRAHTTAPAFTIVPAWDERGSNAIVCSPADLVPLQFGPDSFFPHLAAARRKGVKPTIVRNDAIALDIDEPADLARFTSTRSDTRAAAFLDQLLVQRNSAAAVTF